MAALFWVILVPVLAIGAAYLADPASVTILLP